MPRSRCVWVHSLAALFALGTAACGLRSDPFAPDYLDQPTDGGDDSTDPNGPGTCDDPLSLPFSPMTLRGEIAGSSNSEGWCGLDGGPEDIYTFVPDYDVDVIITIDAEATEFKPTVRVIEDGCEVGTGVTKVCTHQAAERPFHFLAQAGRTYSLIIDSDDEAEGRYEFSIDLGAPSIDQCPVHPESIRQLPGSAFLWNNDFPRGQGQVDTYCGAPGRENMFAVQAEYAGNMYAFVETSGDFASPVLSVRTGCAALSELTCAPGNGGFYSELAYFIPEPGIYYLVVDQGEIGAGGYQLRVDFD